MNHGIRTETEQFYPEARLAESASIAMQYGFFSKCMVTLVVTTATSQTVPQESSNLSSVPNVGANACKVAAG